VIVLIKFSHCPTSEGTNHVNILISLVAAINLLFACLCYKSWNNTRKNSNSWMKWIVLVVNHFTLHRSFVRNIFLLCVYYGEWLWCQWLRYHLIVVTLERNS